MPEGVGKTRDSCAGGTLVKGKGTHLPAYDGGADGRPWKTAHPMCSTAKLPRRILIKYNCFNTLPACSRTNYSN